MVKDDRLQQQGVLNVKKSHLMAVLALCAAGGVVWMSVAGSPAVAQTGQPPAWPATAIALIDINAIFKEHPTFKGEMTQINDDMGRADAKVKTESQDLQRLRDHIKDYNPGSPEYKAAEEAFVNGQVHLQMEVQNLKQEFVLRQAQVYSRVYQEISQEVDNYCRYHGIAMVINFDSGKVDVNKPEEVARMVYRPVVFHDARMDITPRIIDILHQRRPAAPGGYGTMPTAERQGVGGGGPHY